MSIFGWSLPPGCGSLPGEEDYPCEICGEFENTCVCPECPECGSVGDPDCYKPEGCNLILSQEQIDSLAKNESKWAEQNKRDAEMEARLNEQNYNDEHY
jgi:hypothetical protein